MRSMVDCDLANILVLLSSSEMEDGPSANNRFDCAVKQNKQNKTKQRTFVNV